MGEYFANIGKGGKESLRAAGLHPSIQEMCTRHPGATHESTVYLARSPPSYVQEATS